jgi:hypothetical protein
MVFWVETPIVLWAVACSDRFLSYTAYYEPGSSVSIVSGYGLDDRAIEVRSLAGQRGFFL